MKQGLTLLDVSLLFSLDRNSLIVCSAMAVLVAFFTRPTSTAILRCESWLLFTMAASPGPASTDCSCRVIDWTDICRTKSGPDPSCSHNHLDDKRDFIYSHRLIDNQYK